MITQKQYIPMAPPKRIQKNTKSHNTLWQSKVAMWKTRHWYTSVCPLKTSAGISVRDQGSNSSPTTREPVRPPAPVTKMVLAKATAGDTSQQAAQKQSPSSKGFKILLRLDAARPNAMDFGSDWRWKPTFKSRVKMCQVNLKKNKFVSLEAEVLSPKHWVTCCIDFHSS